MRSRRHGVTLIDLMVLILIIGVLIGLILPAIQASRRTVCRTTCNGNLKNVGLGLQGYLNAKGYYPDAGTFGELSGTNSPDSSTILGSFTDVPGVAFLPNRPLGIQGVPDLGPLRSWVVDVLPYLDQQDMADAWHRDRNYASTFSGSGTSNPSNAQISRKSIGVLTCPEDTTLQPGQGNLSYVVNGGFSRWVGEPTIGWTGTATGGRSTKSGPDWGIDVAAQTGVMFLGTDTGDAPWDRRTTAASIVDGAGQTILASENLRAGYAPGSPATGGLVANWACPHPNVVMFIASDKICPGGRCPTGPSSPTLTPAPNGKGDAWTLANAPKSQPFESINSGARDGVAEGASPYPSSYHANGVNVLFCDGSVRFLNDTVDGSVYARLITPAGSGLRSTIQQSPLGPDEY